MVLTRSKSRIKNEFKQDTTESLPINDLGLCKTKKKTKSKMIHKTPQMDVETRSSSTFCSTKHKELTAEIDNKIKQLVGDCKLENRETKTEVKARINRRLFASSFEHASQQMDERRSEEREQLISQKKTLAKSQAKIKQQLTEPERLVSPESEEENKELFEKIQFVLNRFSAIIQRANSKRIFLCDDDFAQHEYAIVSLILYFLSDCIGIRVYGKEVFTEREKKLIMRDRKSEQKVLNFLNYLIGEEDVFRSYVFMELVLLDKNKLNCIVVDNFILNPLQLAIDHEMVWSSDLVDSWSELVKKRYLAESKGNNTTRIFRAETSKDLINSLKKLLEDQVVFDGLPVQLRGLEDTVASTADLTSPHYITKSKKNSSRLAVKMACPSEFVTPTRKPLVLKSSNKIETLTRSSLRRSVLVEEVKTLQHKEKLQNTTASTFWENLQPTQNFNKKVEPKDVANNEKTKSAHSRNLFRAKSSETQRDHIIELSTAGKVKLLYDVYIYIKDSQSSLINKKQLQKHFKTYSVEELTWCLKFLSDTFTTSFSLIETKSGGHILHVSTRADSTVIMNYLKDKLDQSKRSSKSISASSSLASSAAAEAGADVAVLEADPAARAFSIFSSVIPTATHKAIASM